MRRDVTLSYNLYHFRQSLDIVAIPDKLEMSVFYTSHCHSDWGGVKLTCIFVVVVETFQSETFSTLTSYTFAFTVKLHSKANITL